MNWNKYASEDVLLHKSNMNVAIMLTSCWALCKDYGPHNFWNLIRCTLLPVFTYSSLYWKLKDGGHWTNIFNEKERICSEYIFELFKSVVQN